MARSTAGTRSVLCAAFAVLVLQSCAPTLTGHSVLLHPVPPERDGYAMNQGALIFESDDVKVTARPVDWRVVAKECGAPGKVNPFGEGESLSQFIFFSLRFDNKSAKDSITFNPMGSSISLAESDTFGPLNITDIYIQSPGASDLEARAKAFKETSYDAITTVAPGESVEKYLVFATLEGRIKRTTLLLDDVYHGFNGNTWSFDFEVFPGTSDD